jgi:signal transduction histidine kinase
MRLPRLLRTSVFRLTLRYVGIFAVSVMVLFAIVAWSATAFMTRQIDATVAAELTEAKADAGAPNLAARDLRPVIEHLTARSEGFFYLLQDPMRHVLAGNMEAIRPLPGPRVLEHMHRRAGHAEGGIRGRGEILSDGSYLFVGQSDAELGEMQQAIARAFIVGLGATVLLGGLGGIATSLAVMQRIETIGRTTREIMAGDLDRRIALRGTGDEFDRLAGSLNAMLDRIQDLMAGLQRVSGDIAHDLRTPLTRLRQRLELAYRRETAVEPLKAALEGSIGDVDGILETFGALLRIAQIESGVRRSGFARVDIAALIEELAEVYGPVADEKRQTLTVSAGPATAVLGDRELLAQLLVNLIENAIRHAPPGAVIRMDAAAAPRGVEIHVADNGPGIPVALRSKVLERFVRLDESRQMPGNGLGLSLVAAIAALHEAELALLDNEPGLRVALLFRPLPP